MAGTIATLASIGYMADAAMLRAAIYRDKSAQFLKMAAAESVVGLRHRLVDLAHDYHQLAATLEQTSEQLGSLQTWTARGPRCPNPTITRTSLRDAVVSGRRD
jgi:hypothetical protein